MCWTGGRGRTGKRLVLWQMPGHKWKWGNFGKKKIGPAVGKETRGFLRRLGFTGKGTITICN